MRRVPALSGEMTKLFEAKGITPVAVGPGRAVERRYVFQRWYFERFSSDRSDHV